jgi:hypothetical protein
MTLDSKLTVAIERLRVGVDRTHAALVKHERALAVDHYDVTRAELHGFLHRMQRVAHELKLVLATPVPSRESNP